MKPLIKRVQHICIMLALLLAVCEYAKITGTYCYEEMAKQEDNVADETAMEQVNEWIEQLRAASIYLMQAIPEKPQKIIYLKEIPEAGTRGLKYHGAYIVYKDMLVLGANSVYKREDGVYQLTDQTLEDMTKIEGEIEYYEQYEDLILMIIDVSETKLDDRETGIDDREEKFLVYDMDTGETRCYSWGEGRRLDDFNCEFYEGEFYYVEDIENDYGDWTGWKQDMAIRKMNPRTGESVEIYRCEKPVLDNFWFFIRDDGTILFEWVKWGERYADRWEYCKIQPNDDGSWEETKLYENDRWRFRERGQYNAYGFFVIGQNDPARPYTTLFDDIVIKDNGEIETPLWVEGGIRLFCDNGYLLSDTIQQDAENGEDEPQEQETGDVSYYDYHGNKISTWHLIDREYLEKGYKLVNLLYYDGTITGFYQQKGTKALYIAQAEAELEL